MPLPGTANAPWNSQAGSARTSPSCQATAHAKPPPTPSRRPHHALPTRRRRPMPPVLFRSEQRIVTPRVPTATPTPPHLSPTQSHTSHCQNSAATCRADRTALPQRLSAPSVSTPGGCHLPRCPSRLPACPTCPACPAACTCHLGWTTLPPAPGQNGDGDDY